VAISEEDVLAAIREYSQGANVVSAPPELESLPSVYTEELSPLYGPRVQRQVKVRGHALDSARCEKLRQMLVVRGLSLDEAAEQSKCGRGAWSKALSGKSVAGKTWAKIGLLLTTVPPAPGLSELTGLS
jgi:hypothetical protein